MRTAGLTLAILVASACSSEYAGLVGVRSSAELAVRPGSPAELVDAASRVVARAGDRVSLTGGYLDGRAFVQCDVVRVVGSAT